MEVASYELECWSHQPLIRGEWLWMEVDNLGLEPVNRTWIEKKVNKFSTVKPL